MKKRTFCKMIVGAALAIGLSGAAYADDVLAKVKTAGLMKVGTETEFAPFDYIDAGAHAGLNVDLFDEIGKELGVKIEWVALPWDGVLPGLEAGKFDMVAGPATITKARMEHYRFSAPIAEATVALMKRKGDLSDHEARGHRRQDRRRRQGDFAAPAAHQVRRHAASEARGARRIRRVQ